MIEQCLDSTSDYQVITTYYICMDWEVVHISFAHYFYYSILVNIPDISF